MRRGLFLVLVALALLAAACGGSDSGQAVATQGATGASAPAGTPAEARPGTLAPATPAGTTSGAGSTGTTSAATAPVPAAFDPSRVTIGMEQVGSGFSNPVLITHAGDGSGRIFVVEKTGRIRLLDGTPFLDLAGKVISPELFSYEREQGLLGLAFHPRFRENGLLYVHYNDRQGNHVISRFTARSGGPADPASEKVILRQNQPETNFNGGMLAFGRDGYLYIGLGTGGTKVELQQGAQKLDTLLGKLLRIDVDKGDPYAIPPDNPFVGRAGARGEIWAYGLRNPWRFSFDRATGDLYIGGPGEFKREWINLQQAGTPSGQNFGWPVLEGTMCWRADTCDRSGIRLPILEYNTYEEGNCVVIGGYVYRGRAAPLLAGAYFFGDFCSGRVWAGYRDAAGAWKMTEALRTMTLIGSFGEDEAGEVYIADIHGGNIFRITGAAR